MKLIDMAVSEAFEGNLDLSREYVKLAVQYTSKARVKLPLKFKRKYCRKCLTPLIPGVTERRRVRSKILIRTCLVCGWIRRYDTRNKEKLEGRNRRRGRNKDRKKGTHGGSQGGNKETP
ncbi:MULTISPECIES: ribonuclease P protein component 4 [Metallosphaera]|nr:MULTISPECIES: ribonuclease P protein component 4 [Metallosphaera]MCY0861743.1 RNAse P, Rpr2/Rpp21 subunit [Metallosphaera prunae]QCO31167.1 RNAse P, Rpr2/Rpp21 subunit [Metallosphaera prunae]WPX07529.1 ribonuclease P protein component 4 [Metallosphaera sedula DSM 5348]